MDKGYACPLWRTFEQALKLGGNVRKGGTGELVVCANRITRTDDKGGPARSPSSRVIPCSMRSIATVCPRITDPLPPCPSRRSSVEAADRFFANTGADIRHGAASAYYAIGPDYVQIPLFDTSAMPKAMPPPSPTS